LVNGGGAATGHSATRRVHQQVAVGSIA
jgi:hypothetical protein